MNREDIPVLKNILSLNNDNLDVDFLYKVLTVTKDFPNKENDILDSFSNNQYTAKNHLLSKVESFLDKNKEVVIFGSWYGSILVPKLTNKVKRITCIDLDEQVLKISKNKLFYDFDNIEYVAGNLFDKNLSRYHDTNLFINTSCEHMPPMNTFEHWPNNGAYFAFQSNNMDWIEDHTNCVYSIEEFKSQLPANFEVVDCDEIQDSRGTRFMLIGIMHPV